MVLLRHYFIAIFMLASASAAWGQDFFGYPLALRAGGFASLGQSSDQNPSSATSDPPDAPSRPAAPPATPVSKQQPKRILGVMPNYRAVSAGAIPPPPTP